MIYITARNELIAAILSLGYVLYTFLMRGHRRNPLRRTT